METFTFLFTDIEGSTALLGRVGHGAYEQVLADHRSIIRSGIAAHDGREVDTQGDAFFILFSSPAACVAAVIQMQHALQAHAWPAGEHVRVRMGVHTGEASQTATGVVGMDVHRAARVAAAGYGGQVLLSEASAVLVGGALPRGAALGDLGVHRLKDLEGPVRIFQLRAAGLPAEFPPLRTVPGGVAAATRTLPRDLAWFTGRQQELGELADAAAGAGGVVGIHAIGGMAGVGKTAFAVHAAHRLAPRFPAGQIFLQLHGHTPGQQPVEPADALASLLLTAGVPAAQIPTGLEARMALWRDRLAEKQLLLILDDAASSEQVLPLLPGAGGSLVLITSRRHLSALEDATAISLDTLPPEEAAGLLVGPGRAGLSAADPAVGEIIRLCGFLPLAIGMVARQLHHHPAWTAAGRAAELAAAVDRLDLMATENLSVAAAFNLSYQDLSTDQRRLFRRLGLHPGTDIDAYAAAALDGTGLAAARRGLEALYDQYLLAEPAQGRYRLHDLIREHARALAGREDPAPDRDRATTRLLDYYQHTATLADSLLTRRARTDPASAADAIPAEFPALAGQEQALAWARAERANLIACLDEATGADLHARVIALTTGLAGLLRRDGPWAEALARHAAALCSARHLGDRPGQATVLTSMGDMQRLTGDYPGAAVNLAEALVSYRDIGDRPGQAIAVTTLGEVRRMTGDYPAAAAALEEGLGISRDLGDRVGQATALNELGRVRRMTGDYPGATADLEEALCLSRDLGDRVGQANALRVLGDVRVVTGDYPGASGAQEEALGLSRDVGDRFGQANALNSLGRVRMVTGDYLGAAAALEEALGLYHDFGDRIGQANALTHLGEVRRATGDYPDATAALEQALGIFHSLGNRIGQAYALNELGRVQRMAGDYPGAAAALEEALGRYRDLGDRGGEVEVLNEAGTLRRVCGDLSQARSYHQQALDLARQIGSSWDEAHALAGLGRCLLTSGHNGEGEDMLRQALEIFQRIGAAETADVCAELQALTDARPAPHGS